MTGGRPSAVDPDSGPERLPVDQQGESTRPEIRMTHDAHPCQAADEARRRQLTRHALLALGAYLVASVVGLVVSERPPHPADEGLRLAVVSAAVLLLLRHARYADLRGAAARRRRRVALDLQRATTRSTEALQARLDENLQASRTKAAFLARMGHHLRTPMNGVLGTTELALTTELSPEQHDLLSTARSSCHALLTTVDQIIDSARIDAGEMSLVRETVPLHELVREALAPHVAVAAERGIELAARLDVRLPAAVWSDRARLRQVIELMLQHALLGTDRGAVVLSADLHDDALLIAVSDTGADLSPDEAERILRPWEDASQRRDAVLGPSLAAQLVTLMGGTISSANARVEGSRFVISLPVEVAEPVPTPPDLTGVRVLVAEGRMTTRAILSGMLRDLGADVTAAEDGHEALDALEDARADERPHRVLLLDHDMAGREDFERLLDRRFGPEDGRVVLLGGGDDGRPRLGRPVLPDDLFRAVDPSWELRAGEAPRRVVEPVTAPLRVLVVDDSPVSRKVAQRLLAAWGHTVWTARDGRHGLDVLQRQTFDLVLMDVEMPVMDGIEATAMLRERERDQGAPPVPVIAMTAHADDVDRERCTGSGMDGHVPKPVRRRELESAIARVMADRRDQAPAPGSTSCA